MERTDLEQIVRGVIARLAAEDAAAPKGAQMPSPGPLADMNREKGMAPPPGAGGVIPVEVSARHVHLSPEDLKTLFGLGTLPEKRGISQPGQYLSEFRVRLIGPKGILENVAVLGPLRDATQAEISFTDARALGIRAPVRLSGDLSGAATVFLQAGENIVERPCAIVAKRHVHMTPEDAAAFAVRNGQEVSLSVEGARPLTLHGVTIRVSEASCLALHIDTDEANAAGAWGETVCRLAEPGAPPPKESPGACPPAQPGAVLEEKLICEGDVLSLSKSGAKTLLLKKGQLITPLAVDALKTRGITLIREGQG